VNKHHWNLVTLIFCNAVAVEYLPIALENIFADNHSVILVAVLLIVVFGEVLPQAIFFTGSSKLEIAYYLAPFITILMWITAPISWPFSKFLDFAIGGHHTKRFDNDSLKELILLHSK